MQPPFDRFPPPWFESMQIAREVAQRFELLTQQPWSIDDGFRQHQLLDRMLGENEHSRAMLRNPDFLGRSTMGLLPLLEQPAYAMGALSIMARAQEAAELAQSVVLPRELESFRTETIPLANRFIALRQFERLDQPDFVEAFSRASAMSDCFGESTRVEWQLLEATSAFARSAVPTFETLAGYRTFLDAAGLILPRWPKIRLLAAAEKRRRFKARLKQNVEPPHVRRAKSMVHRYELTLREILDGAMAEAYGDDWAETRLPLCGCNDLLGRWRKRGDDVLDHADYAHYAGIMSHPQHFKAIFNAGFDDANALAALLNKAGRLRAASHHARSFTQDDLRDLRLTWLTLEAGLLSLTADYEIEAWL